MQKFKSKQKYIKGKMNLEKLSAGPEDKVPELIYVIIEVPKGSQNKYEIDKESGYLFLDRVLFTSMHYPFDYGFIPKTLCEDGDPLDALVITSFPNFPCSVIKAKPIGLLIMEDEKGEDEKILAVPDEKIDPRFKEIKDIKDIPEHFLEEIKHFFEHYKELEPGKWVKVKEWKGAKEAKDYIKKAIENFNKKVHS
jgi:inorganic pyrophosphatase